MAGMTTAAISLRQQAWFGAAYTMGRFCKRSGSARKQLDRNAGGLRNPMRDINGLAQVGYRYTTPQVIYKQIQ